MHKVIVKKEFPDGVHQLPSTMSDDTLLLRLPASMDVFHDVVDEIWQ